MVSQGYNMVSEIHAILLILFGFVCGILWGMQIGREQYRQLLVLIAKAGSAEKLPDGKFYYLLQEDHTSDANSNQQHTL